MRIKGLLSYLISLAFLMMGIQAVFLPDSASTASGSSVDDYIEQSNSEAVYVPSISNQAKESRERFFEEKENSTLDWTMPSSLSNGGDTPSESRDQVSEQGSLGDSTAVAPLQSSNTSSNVESESTDSITKNASGTWSFRLNDSILRDVSLALFQEGDSVFGSGRLKENNSSYQVMASGMLQGDVLSLDLTSQQPITLYKLLLNLSEDGATGKYSAISASGDKWTGDADGLRLAA